MEKTMNDSKITPETLIKDIRSGIEWTWEAAKYPENVCQSDLFNTPAGTLHALNQLEEEITILKSQKDCNWEQVLRLREELVAEMKLRKDRETDLEAANLKIKEYDTDNKELCALNEELRVMIGTYKTTKEKDKFHIDFLNQQLESKIREQGEEILKKDNQIKEALKLISSRKATTPGLGALEIILGKYDLENNL